MKKYVVMIDYGTEGWKIQAETDNWDEAVEAWKGALRNGRAEIFKTVRMFIAEASREK